MATSLTPRERDVLRCLVSMNGAQNKYIAAELGIGTMTVKQHMNMARLKLGIRGRTSLALWAAEHIEELG